FNLVLNYPQKEIHLLPNSHFQDPFDYSYTGMTMYNQDGIIYVDDIIPGSPADKSGLENGDVVMAIKNNFSGDIEVYKNLLQKSGTRIDVLIIRDNKPTIKHLKIGRIR
ncbi:MAG: PDZ domain-containing protein, partial [Ginsengibacter sp.]